MDKLILTQLANDIEKHGEVQLPTMIALTGDGDDPNVALRRAWRASDDPYALALLAHLSDRRALAVAITRMVARTWSTTTHHHALLRAYAQALTTGDAADVDATYAALRAEVQIMNKRIQARPLDARTSPDFNRLMAVTAILRDAGIVALREKSDHARHAVRDIATAIGDDIGHTYRRRNVFGKDLRGPTDVRIERRVATGIKRFFPAPTLATILPRRNPCGCVPKKKRNV